MRQGWQVRGFPQPIRRLQRPRVARQKLYI